MNDHPMRTLLGCGVKAYNYEDAISLLKEKVFKDRVFPEINKVVDNINKKLKVIGYL